MRRQRLVSWGLAVLLALFVWSLGAGFAVDARAGVFSDDNSLQNDIAAGALVYYWDLRDGRKSFFQVTNTSASPVTIHIQVWNASDDSCPEFDYLDTLTPHDTHLYDVSALDRNNGQPLAAPDLSGGHGVVAVSSVSASDPTEFGPDVLTGNLRIVAEGFEYRTNAAGWVNPGGDNGNAGGPKQFNYNTVDGSTLADLVLTTFDTTEGFGTPGLILDTTEPLEVFLVDEHENVISCPDSFIKCGDPGFENVIAFGVNQLIVNSKGGPSFCLGTDTTGQIIINGDRGDERIRAGFIGLNNGTDTGSMDVWFNGPDVLCDLFGAEADC